MEMRKIYDAAGNFTGRIEEKHVPLGAGDFIRHVIVILKTTDGSYILQQRSLKARHFPGAWDVTGGGVTADETGAEAAVREAREELGVTVDPAKLRFIMRETQIFETGVTGAHIDTYAARVELPEGGMKIAEYEVNDVRLVSYAEFVEKVIFNKSEVFRAALERIEKEI